jgi:hypothetical protein
VNLPAILMAGRGSSYFRLLTKAEQGQLTKMFLLGAGLSDGQSELTFSKDPKQEVARGLLLNSTVAESRAGGTLLLGLGLELQHGGVLAPEAALTDLSNTAPSFVDLTEFEKFLGDLRKAAGISLTISDGGKWKAKQIITQGTANRMVEEARLHRPVQPPFAEALLLLVNMLALPQADRDQLLRVDTV